MLGEITVLVLVRRNCHADRSGHQPVRLIGALTIIDAKNDLARAQQLHALFLGYPFAARGIDARDQNQVAVGQSGSSQGQLKGSKLLFMDAYSFCEEYFSRNHFSVVYNMKGMG